MFGSVNLIGSGNQGSGGDDGGDILQPMETTNDCSVELNIQRLCNGTFASPCDCETSEECQVCFFP